MNIVTENWYDDRNELAAFIRVLQAVDAIDDDIAYCIERTWKSEPVRDLWLSMGRPEPPVWGYPSEYSTPTEREAEAKNRADWDRFEEAEKTGRL